MRLINNLKLHFENPFRLDLRTLALFRILLGLLLIFDILSRLGSFGIFYTESGLIPLELTPYKTRTLWSVFFLSTNEYYIFGVFVWGLLSAICFTIGYRTKLAGIFCWIFICSIQYRAWFLLCGGDLLIRILFFVGIFLPLDQYFSVTKKSIQEKTVFNFVIVLYFIQLCFIYYTAAMGRDHHSWWIDATAISDVLKHKPSASYFAQFILFFPLILKFLTRWTMLIEFFFPFIMFIPFNTQKIKLISALTMMLLHFGILTFMNIGLFPYASMLSWLILLPSSFWEFKYMMIFEKWLSSLFSIKIERIIFPEIVNKALRVISTLVITLTLILTLRGVARPLKVNNLITVVKAVLHMEPYKSIGNVLAFSERWTLFSGVPLDHDKWISIVAFFPIDKEIGEFYNVLQEESFHHTMPTDWRKMYPTFRHWYYFRNIMGFSKRKKKYHPHLTRYYCNNVVRNGRKPKNIGIFIRAKKYGPKESHIYRRALAQRECSKK